VNRWATIKADYNHRRDRLEWCLMRGVTFVRGAHWWSGHQGRARLCAGDPLKDGASVAIAANKRPLSVDISRPSGAPADLGIQMETVDDAWVAREEAKRAFMAENGCNFRRRRAFILRCWLV